jgi:hypothetical protein
MELEQQVIECLLRKETIYSIAKKFNKSQEFVRKRAKDNNIETLSFKDMVKNRRIVSVNPFLDLDNEQVQYWLGFLAADRAIHEGKISLGLQEQDEIHIDKFIKFINPKLKKTKLLEHKKYISYRTSFRNQEICDYLNQLGITSKKSFTLFYNHSFNKHFLRGVIDGDGYIRKSHGEVSIATGSILFAEQIQKFIIDNYSVNCTIRKDNSNIYTVGVYGKTQVTKILNDLYIDAEIYLERKFLNAMSHRNMGAQTP